MAQVKRKVILITGGSSGIGLESAKFFARKGYCVYATSRHCREQMKKYGAGYIIFKKMDVTDEESIKRVICSIKVIDVVLHCAGFGIAGAAEEIPIELVKRQMDTNFFGVLRVNAEVLPVMRKQNCGIIIIVSSVAGKVGIPFQSHYSASKFALEGYAEALKLEVKPFHIGVSLIEPGDTKTSFTKKREVWCPKNSVYQVSCERAVGKMAHDEENGKSSETVARLAYQMAQKKKVPMRKAVGMKYKFFCFLQRFLPSHIFLWMLEKYYC